MSRFATFGRALDPSKTPILQGPAWQQANPTAIERSLQRALSRRSGGWAVLDASRRITNEPRSYRVAGRDLVAWRAQDGLRIAPDACPHMGAPLSQGRVDGDGRLVCPWHGLALDRQHGAWRCLPAFDDGVLAWVRMNELLATNEATTDAPILGERPSEFIDGVIRLEARCQPRDVLANRLDPWHGTAYHPHSFLRLSVIDMDEEQITVRVVYRVLGILGMEVDARFHCPGPRTITMTIVDGDGKGSVVETHATPIDDEHCAVIEASLATSDRLFFPLFRKANAIVRPFIEARSKKLWVDDRAYAERTFALRRDRAEHPQTRPSRMNVIR